MKTAKLKQVVLSQAADQATGCRERVRYGGQLWVSDNEGTKVSDTKAHRLFREGAEIAAPNAGAGSYNAIIKRLGFSSVIVEDWTSSAGDWVFRVRKGMIFQTNRFPQCGFSYTYQKAPLNSHW